MTKKPSKLIFTQQRNFMHFGLRGIESNLRDLSKNISLTEEEILSIQDLLRRVRVVLKRITSKEAREKAKKEIL